VSAQFSPDGTLLVTTVGEDFAAFRTESEPTARIWDAKTGKLLAALEGHTAPLHGAAFSPDGEFLVTASGDHTAKVWDCRPEGRSPAEIADLVKRFIPLRLEGGRVVLADPEAEPGPPASARHD
jgi:WD40 repeat protein